jgi:hypothetical protein
MINRINRQPRVFAVGNPWRTLAVLSGVLISSCATTGESTPPDPATEGTEAEAEAPVDGRRRSSKILTADELDGVYQYNALQAVELLRPNWLRSRGPVTIESSQTQGVRLYVDGNPRGFAADLAGILASEVWEMRYLDSREATTRYGTGYPDGVIVVSWA